MGFFRRLIRRIFRYDWGVLELRHGKHTLHVPTCIYVSNVWVKYLEMGHDGCGQQQHCWVRCHPRGYGIDFYIEVDSEKCVIEWFAT